MKRILFLTVYASPYRVRFFDELGKDAEVTVLFSDRKEDIHHRDAQWFEKEIFVIINLISHFDFLLRYI